jgi:Protein of unknown function DUF262
MIEPDAFNLKAEAATFTVEDLVGQVRRGMVRVPTFQRGLRWKSQDVVALFDSIYRGYPIGSLLLRKGNAESAQILIGPLLIDAPATPAALWVIDGQQRLTALTAGLYRPGSAPSKPDDAYVVFFDVSTESFVAPNRDGTVLDSWVPVSQLLDSAMLSEWVYNWQSRNNAKLRATVFDAGARIRSYKVPSYIVETGDESLLRDIFYRINKYGKGLKWPEVHDALFGRTSEHPSSLRELAETLSELGMGRPEESQLVPCLLAFKGLDVTRTIAEHYRRDPKALKNAVREAVTAIRDALLFLRSHAAIPHLRLLPRVAPLVVLVRFLAIHPGPKARTSELLARWTWRTLLGTSTIDERTLLRHGVARIAGGIDEEKTVQSLLKLVASNASYEYALPARYDARAADSRLALLALASLKPIDMMSGREINIADLIEHEDAEAFRRIVPSGPFASSPANRILMPGTGSAISDLRRLVQQPIEESVLKSHAIDVTAVNALVVNDRSRFLEHRAGTLERAVNTLVKRMAGWSRTDRPSIPYLLNRADN